MQPLAVYAAFSAENSIHLACGVDCRRKTSVTKATLKFLITKPFQKSKIAARKIRIGVNRGDYLPKLAAISDLPFQKLIKKVLVNNSCHQPSSATSCLHFVSIASDNLVFILNVSDLYCVIFN